MDIIAIASRIDRVTVFRQGAKVERVAPLPRPPSDPGPLKVRLTGLPLCLEDGSIRAQLEGDTTASGPVITELSCLLDAPGVNPDGAPADDAEVRAARARVNQLTAMTTGITRALDRLGGLDVLARPVPVDGTPPVPTPLEARGQVLELRLRRFDQLAARRLERQQELDQARRELEIAEARYAAASTSRQVKADELRKTILVTITGVGEAADPVRLRVEYMVPGARWAPTYALALLPGLAKGTLSLRARVVQSSGEDWTDAGLNFSTASAQGFTALPELKSVRIGRHQLPPRTGWRPSPVGAQILYEDFDRTFKAPPTPQAPAAPPPPPPPEPCFDSGATLQGLPVAECSFDDSPELGAMSSGAFPAAPASRPAPAPQVRAKRAMAPPVSMTLRPGAAAPPDSVSRMDSRSRPRAGGMGGGYAGAPPPEVPAGPPVPAPELMDYGRLRMAGPDSHGRGQLSHHGGAVPEFFLSVHVGVQVDVVMAVRQAWTQACRPDSLSLPPGCRPVQAVEHYDFAYAAAAPVSVASDGAFHSVGVQSLDLSCQPTHVVVPRESPDVFRVLTFTNPLEGPLLPGPVDVTVGGDFLLTATIAATGPRGEVHMGVGVEEGIKAARRTQFKEVTTGLLTGTSELHHSIEVELVNHTAHPASLEVRERVPRPAVPKDDVTVEITAAEPPWEPFEQKSGPLSGGHRWRLTLGAGERRLLKAGYVARLPSKFALVGGNRREA